MRELGPDSLEKLDRLIGVAHDAGEVNRELSRFARGVGASVIGAHQITCSDESERE